MDPETAANYYKSQALGGQEGYGQFPVFTARRRQYGGGFFDVVRRYGVPLLKYLGKEVLGTAVKVGEDVLDGKDIKEAASVRVKAASRKVGSDAITRSKKFLQTGGKRRKSIKRKGSARKRPVKVKLLKTQHDIFA